MQIEIKIRMAAGFGSPGTALALQLSSTEGRSPCRRGEKSS